MGMRLPTGDVSFSIVYCTYSWSLQETPGVWECDTGSNQPSCEGASQLKETTATEKHRTITNDNDNSTGWWVNSCSRLYCVVYSFIPNFLLLGLCLSNTWMNGENWGVLGLLVTWLTRDWINCIVWRSPSTADEAWYWLERVLRSGWLYITSRTAIFQEDVVHCCILIHSDTPL